MPNDDTAHRSSELPAGRRTSVSRRILGAYKQMLASLFAGTFAVVALLLLMILPFFYSYFFNKDPTAKEPSIFLIVALAGSLGAFVSALTRLYHFQDLPTALVAEDLKGLHSIYLAIYSFVPPFVGAISAAVLYMVFAGGLFDGALFPHFVCKLDQGCRSFANFISYWGPDDAPDYAKALVLGFVAGFAERFVPDTLSALAKSANETHPK